MEQQVTDSLVQHISKQIIESTKQQVASEVFAKLQAMDITQVINEIVKSKVESLVKISSFPERSISAKSINFSDVKLSGDMIKGGIIENFGSTGIEDRATFVQLTLMDHACAFEGPIYAPTASIKGDLKVDGNLIVKGTVDSESPMFSNLIESASERVKNKLDSDFFSTYSTIIFNKILEDGLDLDRITQNQKEIIKGNRLGYHITDSNLQRVGMLNDLQSTGETYLSETLYASKSRVGINTIEPSSALAVWDEECEIVLGKRKKDVGFIGTNRPQTLILGSNNQDNIKLGTDGSVQIDKLTVNNVSISSAPVVPNTVGKKGQVVFNENPRSGDSVGWVCLGGTQWAGFGTIE